MSCMHVCIDVCNELYIYWNELQNMNKIRTSQTCLQNWFNWLILEAQVNKILIY